MMYETGINILRILVGFVIGSLFSIALYIFFDKCVFKKEEERE